MMFTRFSQDAREIATRSRAIAQALGSSTVEPEHLLFALVEQTDTTASRVFADRGFDGDGIRELLESEQARLLSLVGVSVVEFDLPDPTPTVKEPRWSTPAKRALERALDVAAARGDRRIGPDHVLIGVLRARGGGVARALAGAGISPMEMERQVEAVLDGHGPR